jgi:sporulation protein YlmC with PRC-barrel domain
MRLSELIGKPVVDREGTALGYVADLRLVQDGPMLGPIGASLRVSGLVVVERRHLRLFGYERDVGPWLVSIFIRRLARQIRYVAWDQIDEFGAGTVRLNVGGADVADLADLPDRRSMASRQ